MHGLSIKARLEAPPPKELSFLLNCSPTFIRKVKRMVQKAYTDGYKSCRDQEYSGLRDFLEDSPYKEMFENLLAYQRENRKSK